MPSITFGSKLKYNESGELLVYTNESYKTFTVDYANAQNDVAMLTPSSGKKLEIIGVYASTDDKLTNIDVHFDSGTQVFKLYTTNQQTSSESNVHIEGDIDESLDVTCGAGTFISVVYYEK